MLPAIEQGAGQGWAAADSGLVFQPRHLSSPRPEEELFVRAQIAFYASTPSYRPVMALHGWQDMAESLSALAGRGAVG